MKDRRQKNVNPNNIIARRICINPLDNSPDRLTSLPQWAHLLAEVGISDLQNGQIFVVSTIFAP